MCCVVGEWSVEFQNYRIYDLNYVTLLNIFHEIQYNSENKWKDTD